MQQRQDNGVCCLYRPPACGRVLEGSDLETEREGGRTHVCKNIFCRVLHHPPKGMIFDGVYLKASTHHHCTTVSLSAITSLQETLLSFPGNAPAEHLKPAMYPLCRAFRCLAEDVVVIVLERPVVPRTQCCAHRDARGVGGCVAARRKAARRVNISGVPACSAVFCCTAVPKTLTLGTRKMGVPRGFMRQARDLHSRTRALQSRPALFSEIVIC